MNTQSDRSKTYPVTASASYPPVKVSCKNSKWADLIICAIRSQSSELTAITGYLYQHWTLACRYPAISELVYRIAVVEMHHLDTLGELVVLLGGDPRFAKDACACWTGMAPDYSMNIRHLLMENLTSEQAAMDYYQHIAQEIKDPCVSQVINRIAMDEQVHVRIFKHLLETVS